MRLSVRHSMFAQPVLLSVLLLWAAAAQAGSGVISGYFRGNEMKAAAIGEPCGNGTGPRLYRALGPVTASQTGAYNFSDTGHHYALDTQLAIYTSFDFNLQRCLKIY